MALASGLNDDFREYTRSQRTCFDEKSNLIVLPSLPPVANRPSVEGAFTHLFEESVGTRGVGPGECVKLSYSESMRQ